MKFLFVLLILSTTNLSGANITFCDEKYFDNVFQIRDKIYLNVFDKSNEENRLYEYEPGSSKIQQYIDYVHEGILMIFLN